MAILSVPIWCRTRTPTAPTTLWISPFDPLFSSVVGCFCFSLVPFLDTASQNPLLPRARGLSRGLTSSYSHNSKSSGVYPCEFDSRLRHQALQSLRETGAFPFWCRFGAVGFLGGFTKEMLTNNFRGLFTHRGQDVAIRIHCYTDIGMT